MSEEDAKKQNNPDSFAAKVKRLRISRGLTIRGMAKELGVSHSTITRWEQGRMHISHQALQLMADFLKVPPAYFFDTVSVDALLKESQIIRRLTQRISDLEATNRANERQT